VGIHVLGLLLPLAAALTVGCYLVGNIMAWLWPTVVLFVTARLACLAVRERSR
jgi:hypothetical protein